MLKITILQIGKTKNYFLKNLIDEYHKRLGSFAQLFILIKKNEDVLWTSTPKDAFIVLLDDSGKQYSSKEFANMIEVKKNQGISHLVFLIGPADGFLKAEKFDLKLSLSPMTFSHQTIRLILAEQLYRVFCILENKPFPK